MTGESRGAGLADELTVPLGFSAQAWPVPEPSALGMRGRHVGQDRRGNCALKDQLAVCGLPARSQGATTTVGPFATETIAAASPSNSTCVPAESGQPSGRRQGEVLGREWRQSIDSN